MMNRVITIGLFAVLLGACNSTRYQKDIDEEVLRGLPNFEVVAELTKGPGNITVTPYNEVLVSLHQFYGEQVRVAKLNDEASLVPYAEAAELNSVLGLQADAQGIVWLLDNAMRGGSSRRLVGWHDKEQRVVHDIDLSSVTNEHSFLNDLAVDAERQVIYIADPAQGESAAIIIVDVAAGTSRRRLQGNVSVTAEDLDLIIDSVPVSIRIDEGTVIRPRVGINPIALDYNNEWLYYGPMHGLSLYRIKTVDLRNADLTQAQLAARVQRWSDKPISDGITIDKAGNIYLGDLANNAIGVITPDREYEQLWRDPILSWVDAFSFGPDGMLYSVINQLHRSAILNSGKNVTKPPYLVVRFEPFASGTTGR